MENIIRGKVFVLGENIDTDQVIPANYLVYKLDDEEESKNYGKYAFSGVPIEQSGLPEGNIPFVKEGFKSEYQIVVGGKNFGCGSSREHAPYALAKAGVKAVVAPFYARIFYRNSIDGGFFVPFESQESLTTMFKTGDEAEIDIKKSEIKNVTNNKIYKLNSLGNIAKIIEAGNIFEYAKKAGMIK